ncbi:family 78 glycoside hydrolase catalytic domain [Microlunatus elymi]|uniref:family 78 glycoside hydrolase catalytic domain n=1 Tax=Microlunatus elymi TaxID=2596828 RepID=UPI00143D42A4|nr:family 78 glycoside hydrolase catalytic domain [Microlunatus elymi]
MTAARIVDLEDAAWITHPHWANDEPPPEPPVLRTVIEIDQQPVSARVTIAALGVWVGHLGGRPVTADVLEPGSSEFRTRVAATSHDLTELLVPGRNEFVLQLGEGSAHVRRIPGRYTKFEGRRVAPRARVTFVLDFADGSRRVINSGDGWQARLGPTTLSHWYGGEEYDARLQPDGWLSADGTGDHDWTAAVVVDAANGPQPWQRHTPPARVIETLQPVSRTSVGDAVIFDFGRNLAGREVVRLGPGFPPGARVELWPAEYLNESGQVDQHSTGRPIFDCFRGRGGAAQWRPQFCYHGFRYLEARLFDADGTAMPATVELITVEAERIMTADRAVGSFASSDPVLDGIHRLVGNAIDSNLMSVPTDCPHREKLGWLEQDHLVFEPVSFRYDVRGHFADLITHLADAQTAEGLIPDIAPELVIFDIATHIGSDFGYRDDVNWGSAIWRLPLLLYRTYGDLGPAREAWAPGLRYLAYIDRLADAHPDHGKLLDHGLADWISLDDSTPRPLVASYGHARMLDAAAELAPLIGHEHDAVRFRRRAAQIRAELARQYLTAHPERPVTVDSQASLALLLDLGGVLDGRHQQAAESLLLQRIHADGDRFTIGEIGLPALLRQLTRLGEHELIRTMATRTDQPSYGQMLADGCTALAEHWTGVASGASANHFMLGYIDRWLTGSVAGLAQAPDDVGWRRARIAPIPLSGVDSARAEHRTALGLWAVDWSRDADRLRLTVVVPAGGEAELITPPGMVGADHPSAATAPILGPGEHVLLFR